ncbi:MAG TPA: hypothetical protein VGF97_02080 [Rhizomicrobium sp.]|jgi:hypothetical protein
MNMYLKLVVLAGFAIAVPLSSTGAFAGEDPKDCPRQSNPIPIPYPPVQQKAGTKAEGSPAEERQIVPGGCVLRPTRPPVEARATREHGAIALQPATANDGGTGNATTDATGLGLQTIGPMRDGQIKLPPNTALITSGTEMFDGDEWYVVTDSVGLGYSEPDLVMYYEEYRTVGYITSDSGNFTKGPIRVTTIYGIDLSPKNPNHLVLTGFNPKKPPVKFVSETMHGKSGRNYHSDRGQFVAISHLRDVLGPQFDLSPFHGDPNSVVWVFSTPMPAEDLLHAPHAIHAADGSAYETIPCSHGDSAGEAQCRQRVKLQIGLKN